MPKSKSGFTIVELLIVIVVIAILAAISIVAFNGVQKRARESAAVTSLQQAAHKIGVWRVDNGDTTTPTDLSSITINDSEKIKYQYLRENSNANYCITVTVDNIVSFYVNDTTQKTPIKGACVGHTDAGSSTPAATAFTNTSIWTLNAGVGANTSGDTVWINYVTGSGGLTGANMYLTTARPVAELNNLDISWQISTNGTNAGTQYFDVAMVKGDIAPIPNYGGWQSDSAKATVGYTGDGVWQTVRWQSTVSGNTLTWSVTKDGVAVNSGTKDISTWSSPGWRLVPINSWGNRNNVRVGVKGTINLP